MSSADVEVRPDLYVRALGRFAATTSDGMIVELPKKAQALLCFLIARRGRAVCRDEVAGLLWSNGTSAQSRHSLRQCLTTLRRRLPRQAVNALVIEAEALKLVVSDHFVTDVEVFERLVDSSAQTCLTGAASLYSGPLLDGISLSSDSFDDWLVAERERLVRLHLDLTERLARAVWGGGDTKAAIAHARALVSADPLREESVRLLMEILAADGQRSAALLEFGNLKRRLREELQVDPDPMTRALAEQIRRSTRALDAMAPRRSAPPISSAVSVPRRNRRYSGEPRITVLPFKNWTGQGQTEPLARAVAEDVSTALACDRMLQVEVFDDESDVPLAAIRDQPDYAVTSSVRAAGPHLSVAVQLLCGRTRRCLWSDRFACRDRATDTQNAVPLSIAAHLSYAIRSVETRKARSVPLDEMSVVQIALASAAISRKGQPGNAAAVSMLTQAIDAEPDLGILHAGLSRCFHVQRLMGWLPPGDHRLARGLEHARQARELSCDDSEALWMSGLACMNIGGDLAEARYLIDRSMTLNPSSVNALVAACFLECQSGQVDMAIAQARRAAELNPVDNSHHVQKSAEATALFVAGDYKAADTACKASLVQRPGYAGALRIKIATASLLGQREEAESAAGELLKREPNASIARMRDYWKWLAPNAPDALDAKLDGWRRAGMPE